MNDRPSKKLFITVICIQAVVGMAEGAADKLKFAIIIGIILLIYKVSQSIIDLRKGANNGKNGERTNS